MAKGKEVSVKDCLELMRKYEAVEATMKKLKNPMILMLMRHMHKIQLGNHKEMG